LEPAGSTWRSDPERERRGRPNASRRTWELVEDLNTGLGTPVVETAAGGNGGGGTVLTPAGKAIIEVTVRSNWVQ
jgi:hypothetical protein